MEITQNFKDALTRQANEAVRIYSRPDNELLNSKSEFNHPPLARIVVERKTGLRFGNRQKLKRIIVLIFIIR